MSGPCCFQRAIDSQRSFGRNIQSSGSHICGEEKRPDSKKEKEEDAFFYDLSRASRENREFSKCGVKQKAADAFYDPKSAISTRRWADNHSSSRFDYFFFLFLSPFQSLGDF